MSQDGSCDQINSDLSDELVLAKHRLVETNASDLIDELFLEQSLNQTVPLLPDPKPAIRDTLQPVYQPGIVILVFRTLIQSFRVVSYRQPGSYVASTKRLSPRSSKQTYHSSEQIYQSDLFASRPVNNHFILYLACASVTMALLLWVGSQVKLSTNSAASPVLVASQESSPPTVSAAKVQPTAHEPHLQSVNPEKLPQPIDQEGAEQITLPTKVPQPAKVPLPVNPQVPANVVIPVPARVKPERVYVPVYQPSPTQETASKPRIAYKASIPSATIPLVSSSPGAPTTHTLVGVMEFGDRSAALVDINHVTRRISVGEMLTPGGWKLTKVAGQTAVLQRGGRLRSIYVGQMF
jgi:hypothetical protein